jgi:LysR family transcriptional regulator, glycine cleavage system transcriptional activator
VVSDENFHRIHRNPPPDKLEGFPLQHLSDDFGETPEVGWAEWVAAFGHRRTGVERGVRSGRVAQALKSVAADVGVLLCPLTLVADRIAAGELRILFGMEQTLPARNCYRVSTRAGGTPGRHRQMVLDWLRAEHATAQGSR